MINQSAMNVNPAAGGGAGIQDWTGDLLDVSFLGLTRHFTNCLLSCIHQEHFIDIWGSVVTYSID